MAMKYVSSQVIKKKRKSRAELGYVMERQEKEKAKEDKKLKKLRSKSERQQLADGQEADASVQEHGGVGLSPKGYKIQKSINEMCANPLEK